MATAMAENVFESVFRAIRGAFEKDGTNSKQGGFDNYTHQLSVGTGTDGTGTDLEGILFGVAMKCPGAAHIVIHNRYYIVSMNSEMRLENVGANGTSVKRYNCRLATPQEVAQFGQQNFTDISRYIGR